MRRGVSSGLYVVSFCRSFIVDFVLRDSSDYRVGVECDGKKFHDASRDEWRDAMIIGENHLDAIYRLRGSDINYYIEDVLYLIAELEPSLFSPRAASNLKVLASPEVKEICKGHDRDIYLIHYKNEDDIGGFYVEARRRIVPSGQRWFWQAVYRHAVSIGGGKLDAVMADFRNS
jgi:hypothetical protein